MAAIYLLLLMDEERDHRRNYERINRRRIRDNQDPFDMPVDEFKRNYRYPQVVILEIVSMLRPNAEEEKRITKIPLEIRFLISMGFFAQGSHQRSFGKDFHHPVSQSMASSILKEITDLLITSCLDVWIKFPTTEEEKQEAKMGFFINFNMSGIIFAVDGTKVLIYPPPVNHPEYPERLYVDRSGKHSLNIQLTCDANKEITSMNSKFPGSVHDTFIWRGSTVNHFMKQQYENGNRNQFGLGDSGYPMLPYLLTPYPEGPQLQPHQEAFNVAHKAARSIVERTIGAWKNTIRCMGRFRSLHYTPPRAARLCLAGAILYNIGRRRNVIDDNYVLVVDDDDGHDLHDDPNAGNNLREEGRQARENYAQMFYV